MPSKESPPATNLLSNRERPGIVADSVPAREYDECMNKARAVLRALQMAEKGL